MIYFTLVFFYKYMYCGGIIGVITLNTQFLFCFLVTSVINDLNKTTDGRLIKHASDTKLRKTDKHLKALFLQRMHSKLQPQQDPYLSKAGLHVKDSHQGGGGSSVLLKS